MTTETKLPKSKRYIRKAFLELLSEMPYQEITVKNIAERSELGRATFYLHYKDKDELLDEIESDLINGLLALIREVQAEGTMQFLTYLSEGYHPGFAGYFRYIRKNSEALKVLLSSKNGINFWNRFSNDVQDFHLSTYKWLDKESEQSRRSPATVVLRVGASNFTNFFQIWLECDMLISEDEMSRLLCSMWRGYIMTGHTADPSSFYASMANTLKQMDAERNLCKHARLESKDPL